MPDTLDLLTLTRKYIDTKHELESIEVEYELIKAKAYLSSAIQTYGNAQARDAAIIVYMNDNHADLLNKLYDARGKAREAYFVREAIIEMQKAKRSRPVPGE